MNQLDALKALFQKKEYYLCKPGVSIPILNFTTLWEKSYFVYTCELPNFQICFWRFQRVYPVTIRDIQKNKKKKSISFSSCITHLFELFYKILPIFYCKH